MQRRERRSTISAAATKKNTWNGLRVRSATKRGSVDWKLRFSGWPRANRKTGNISDLDSACHPERRRGISQSKHGSHNVHSVLNLVNERSLTLFGMTVKRAHCFRKCQESGSNLAAIDCSIAALSRSRAWRNEVRDAAEVIGVRASWSNRSR